MATLAHSTTGQTTPLGPRHLVGRSTRCDLQLTNPRVSGEHAVLLWDGVWQVRDLGSRNRTFVDGRPLRPGEIQPLAPYSTLTFGSPEDSWVLVDDAAPGPAARTLDGRWVIGEGQTLGLPSPQDPRTTVVHDGRAWVAETPDERRVIADGEALEVQGETFVLSLPEHLPRTAGQRPLSECGLRFSVSYDEEYVEVELVLPDRREHLGSRAHHFLLLNLTRARLEDRTAGHTETSAGWVYQDDLARRMGLTDNAIYLHIHRARTQLAKLDLLGAADIVERRPASRQIRIGLADLFVHRI